MRPPAHLAKSPLATILLLLAAGCSGGGSSSAPTPTPTPTPTPANTPATSVYLFQDNDAFAPPGPSEVLQFPKTGTGSVAPLSTITGPANVIFQTLVEDPTGNLYVGANTYNAAPNSGPGVVDILVYAPSSTGTATPVRHITGAATGLQLLSNNPIGSLDLDSAGNLYVAAAVEFGSGRTGTIITGLSVFAPAANGDAAPTRVIAGPLTTMTQTPQQIAVTPSGTVFYPAPQFDTPGSILLFPPTATGNVAPVATIAGPLTTLFEITGIAVDAAGNIYVANKSQRTSNAADSFTPSILVFAPGTTGNVAPTRIISGSNTTMGLIGNLRVDSAGEIFILNGTSLLKFAAGATGNIAPVDAITSTSYFQPLGSIAVQ